MQRPRSIVLAGGIAAALAAGPILGAVALAADPTVVVQAGETLTAISRRHDVSVSDLVRLNGIADPSRIFAGQTLRIGVQEAPPAAPSPATVPGAPVVHVVQRGENLTTIARHYGVTIGAIAAQNGIGDPSRIYAGQSLTIPGSAPAQVGAAPAEGSVPTPPAPAPAAAPEQIHVVERGENLTTIARHYGVSIAAIAAANGLSDPSRIFGGQRLTIPGAGEVVAPAAEPTGTSMPPSMAAVVASRDGVRRIIMEEAARYGVPAPFALAVAWQESGWQQGVVSHAGAMGVMQLMPATAAWVGEAMLGTPVDAADTHQNVRAGVRLLAHYLERYSGNRELVLAAYYQGQRAVDHHGIYPVSRPYIASILVLERLFGG